MTGPSAPRPERRGTPGTTWEQLVQWNEVVVPEDDGSAFGWSEPGPRPNRATRRAAARAARKRT